MSSLQFERAPGLVAGSLSWLLALLLFSPALVTAAAEPGSPDMSLFARSNLVAWCIVPFDAKQRGPEERARMLAELGLRRMAYDWRAEHIPTFDEEIAAMRRHGIEITAWWLAPDGRDATTQTILEVCERNNLQTQFWTLIGEPLPGSNDQAAKIQAAARQLRPLAEEAARIGCKLALYNHGGWFGEPENQIAIIKELNLPNVGLVYNFHHGHQHIERFPEMFARMKPHLLALNLNGMISHGDELGRKIRRGVSGSLLSISKRISIGQQPPGLRPGRQSLCGTDGSRLGLNRGAQLRALERAVHTAFLKHFFTTRGIRTAGCNLPG